LPLRYNGAVKWVRNIVLAVLALLFLFVLFILATSIATTGSGKRRVVVEDEPTPLGCKEAPTPTPPVYILACADLPLDSD
jgi:hypothetical protein